MAYQSAPASLSMESVACFASVGFAIVHADNNVAARSVIGPRIRVQLDAGYEVLAYTVALLREEHARLASKQSFPVDFRDRIQHERKTGRPRDCDIRLRHTRRAVHGQAQGRGTTAAALSPLCDRSGGDPVRYRGTSGRARAGCLDAGRGPTLRWRRHPTPLREQRLPTATASVGLIASGQWASLIVAEDLQGFDAVAPSRAIAAQVLQS